MSLNKKDSGIGGFFERWVIKRNCEVPQITAIKEEDSESENWQGQGGQEWGYSLMAWALKVDEQIYLWIERRMFKINCLMN